MHIHDEHTQGWEGTVLNLIAAFSSLIAASPMFDIRILQKQCDLFRVPSLNKQLKWDTS